MAGFNSRSRGGTLAEINVTPLVDVMLVLLVIFMITAPMMKMGANVDLPEAKLDPIGTAKEELVISIGSDRKIAIGENTFTREELEKTLSAQRGELKQGKQIYVAADQGVPYGFVMEVLESVKKAGFDNFGLMTQPPREER